MRVLQTMAILCGTILLATTAFSANFYSIVENKDTNETFSIGNLKSKFDLLSNESNASRREFENMSTYESRLLDARQKLKKMTETNFLLNAAPDSCSLNWENASIMINLNLPLKYHRTRGGGKLKSKLSIPVIDTPKNVRVYNTFCSSINMSIQFNISLLGNMNIQSVDISNNGREIYSER